MNEAQSAIAVTVDSKQIGTMGKVGNFFVWQPDTDAIKSLGLELPAALYGHTADSLRDTILAVVRRQQEAIKLGNPITDADRDPLDPSLRAFLIEIGAGRLAIMHPLLIVPSYFAAMAPIYNTTLVETHHDLRHAEEQEDWETYIALHEKPYRVDALTKIALDLSDEDYWTLVGDVWIQVENIHEDFDAWAELWSNSRPGRPENVMDEAERAALTALPEVIEIYRGYRHEECMFGMSWTTDRNKAVWFSKRSSTLGHRPYLATAKVHKEDVLAHFLRRDESEIVVLPENLLDVQQELLEQPTEEEEPG